MAIFEKSQPNVALDDTERLLCTLENAHNINKHTEYVLRVQRGPNKENKWAVSRRYRDFAALHVSLLQANIDLPIPPKKLIGNMQPSFIAERQIALQTYINEVLKHQILSLSFPVRNFLDPDNYPVNIAEQALQTMSIALRGDGCYELKGPLPNIGWRVRKHYFLVTDMDSKKNCLLAWQNYGPDRHLHSKDFQTAFNSLLTMSHPNIDKILAVHNLESGAFVVRRIHESGTIKDLLYGTVYSKTYLSKYGNPKVRKPFTTGQIAHYGYQILQALKFLHEKGLPHGHIHPGNIAIENQRALVMDVENALAGAPGVYRPWLVRLRRAAAETVDVHCFGRTLYEMTFAAPLDELYCDSYPDGLSEDLESVLRLCLSSSSCKHGGPSLTDLLQHPFFTRATLNDLTLRTNLKGHLKFPLTLKDELKAAVDKIETRLRRDQKLERSAKREVRIQEILNSEEEMRKQRRRTRRRESLWKSCSSLADGRSRSGSTASSPTPPALSADSSGASSQAAGAEAAGSASGAAGAGGARSALLDAICAFDKGRLARTPRGEGAA